MCTLENEIDYNYLTPLMRSIVLVPMPKAFEEPQTEDNGILIQNVVPQNSILSKVNFYIKTPVELLILDAIWMLMVGKIAYQQSSISSCAYANRPKFDQLYKNADSLYSGIDFASNRLFVPYFKQYTAWRNNAFKKVKGGENNVILIGTINCLEVQQKRKNYPKELEQKKKAAWNGTVLTNQDKRNIKGPPAGFYGRKKGQE